MRVLAGETSGTAVIVVDGAGENSIVVVAGANGRLAAADVEAAVAGAAIVLVQLEIPEAAVAAAARGAARLVLNASPVRALADDVLAAADPLIVNAGEAAALAGRGRRRTRTRSRRRCSRAGRARSSSRSARTGPAGRRRRGRSRVRRPRSEVVDTTGAGDVFAGTLAAELSRGAEPEAALAAAVAAGAEAVGWRGAQPA